MNKKSLFGLFAMGALLFTASCQEEDVVKQAQENSLATVSINVTTPEMGVATRAMTFGNGKTAKTLHYAVYNVKDQGLTYLPDLTVDNHPIDISTTVDLQLVTGNDYKVIFWAGNDAAISSDQERLYTLNWDAKDENGACKPTMTVNYDYALSNQEAYDAFFNWMDINVDKSKTVSITLNRPFAQLNIGASDIDKAKSAGYTLQKTEVRMTAYTTLDFWSRDVDRESETTDVIIFDPTNYPNYGKTKPATEEELAASDWEEYQVKGYEYMAMNYLLRPLDENRELEDVEFYFYAEDGEMKERKYASVPFRRNWRTNVYGQLITSDVDVNVTINPIFEGSYNIGVWDGHTLAKPYSFLNDNNTPDNDKDDFYEVHVYNGAELAYIADAINGGHQSNAENNGTRAADPNDNVDYYTATIVLKENVDLGGENWKPIYGVKSINDKGKEVLKRFTGTFDGNGHTISNLYVSTEGNASAGLFATTGGIIKNLTVIDAKIYGHYKAGVIAGDGLCGKFENCKVDASNPAKPNVVLSTPHQTETGYNDANHVGGIVGYLSAEPTGYVKGCTVKNTVITGFRDVAGIAGTANTTKSNVPEVTGNMIENVTITADQTVEYFDNGKDGNAGAIAGRIHANTKMENNTVGENVTVIRKVDSTKEMEYAVADAQDGDIIYVGDGEVALPHFEGKALKFIGIHENAAIAEPVSSHIDAFWKGSSLSFENLKIKGTSYTGKANGYVQSAKEEYTNCQFVDGYYMFAGDVTTVTGGKFTGKYNSYFWTGSADDITFTQCEFNGVERIVKVCTVGNTGVERKVTFNGCSFSATEQNKAAIEIDGTKGSSYIVNINNCQETGFAAGEFTGISMFNIVEEADVNTVDVYVDGNKFVAEGLLEDEGGNQIASTDKGLKTALSSKKENIYLTTGEFNVDLYSIADRQTLNIVGTEGTKVKFSNLQVRASQFDNFTIEGCEIMRMPNKSWGHLVFGSSNKANGVYTIKNCVFNGVGSQGIYINEQVSGATYNIIDCTFNGDFGGEGAVTIQNNDDVNHTVNVTGCTFNNIPDTSHEIYILYGYNGWTLNAEGVDAYWKTGE